MGDEEGRNQMQRIYVCANFSAKFTSAHSNGAMLCNHHGTSQRQLSAEPCSCQCSELFRRVFSLGPHDSFLSHFFRFV